MNARRLALAVAVTLCALTASLVLGAVGASAALRASYARELTGAGTPDGVFQDLRAESVAIDGFNHDTLVAEQGSGDFGLVKEFDALGGYVSTLDGASTPAGDFGQRIAVAVSDATGDIYVTDTQNQVVDVFDATGALLATWQGSNTPAGSFGQPRGIAIDQGNGDVLVPDPANDVIDVFDAAGAYLSQITGAETPSGSFQHAINAIAVNDTTGEVYAATEYFQTIAVLEFDAAGKYVGNMEGSSTPAGQFAEQLGVAVSDATGDVLIADRGHAAVDVFNAAGAYLTPQIADASVPAGVLDSPAGVAIDQASGDVYVSEGNIEPAVVKVFATASIPDVFSAPPSSTTPTAVTLNGRVDPLGGAVTDCQFEYGTEASEPAYAHSVACAQTLAQIGSGSGDVPVSASVSGLEADTTYHFRLDASNVNGVNTGEDATFFTSTAPLIEAETSSGVGSAGATVGARLDAAGLPTSYRVEFGPSAAYGSSTAEEPLTGQEPIPVLVALNGLAPGTVYHFRFVASNALGITVGSDLTFTSALATGTSGTALPDGRVYELVSPQVSEDREVFVPEPPSLAGAESVLFAGRPFQASPDGDAFAYLADPSPGGSGSGGSGFGDEYLAVRAAAGGWASTVITPTGASLSSGIYLGFSEDLSVGLLEDYDQPALAPGVQSNCVMLYARSVGQSGYQPQFAGTVNPAEDCYGTTFAGASVDGSHVLIKEPAALTADAPGSGAGNVYELAAGQAHLINVLPDGAPVGNATVGPSHGEAFMGNAISADGSRVFWTDQNDGDLYVRENADQPQSPRDGEGHCTAPGEACTLLIAAGGEYRWASKDGSTVLYTEGGDLYSFDVGSGRTSDLAPGGEVQGVSGVSDDGSYVYFVAAAALATGASPGQPNLYVHHGASTRYIATLAGGDLHDWSSIEPWSEGTSSAEAPSVANTAEVTPDGRSLVFMSAASPTAYDSAGIEEVYVYDADSAQLDCASCAPNGVPPSAGGGYLSEPTGDVRLPRWISEDGTRVFFDSREQLVPQATNRRPDVYEWEREGAGACGRGGGCLYLISRGTDGDSSFFVDASANGDDAFFTTRAQLIAQDQNTNVDLYDARVNGLRALEPPACTGAGCQGVPPAPPIFATPASVTFNGVGDFPPPKPAPKPKSAKCKRGFVKKHGRCVKQKPKKPTRKSKRRSKKGRK